MRLSDCLNFMVFLDNRIHTFWIYQAALRALESITVKSETVENRRRSLNVLSDPGMGVWTQ